MDPKELNNVELSSFLELFRYSAIAGRNRFFLDMMVIVEKEMIARHTTTEITHYNERELVDAIEQMKSLVDQLRDQGMANDYPALRFVLVAMTAAIGEMERRQGAQVTH